MINFQDDIDNMVEPKYPNIRENMYSAFKTALEDCYTPTNRHFKHERTPEYLKEFLPPGTKVYGCLFPGVHRGMYKSRWGYSTDPVINSIHLSFLTAYKHGNLVPEAKGVGFREHFARSISQSIVDTFMFTHTALDFSNIRATIGSQETQDTKGLFSREVLSSIEYLKEDVVPLGNSFNNTEMENKVFSAKVRDLSNFIKVNLSWYSGDFLFKVSSKTDDECYESSHNDRIGSLFRKNFDGKTTTNFYPLIKMLSYTSRLVNGLLSHVPAKSELTSILEVKGRSSRRYSGSALIGNNIYNNTKTSDGMSTVQNKTTMIAFLLAPGLFVDMLSRAAATLDRYRLSTTTEIMRPNDSVILRHNNYLNPIASTLYGVEDAYHGDQTATYLDVPLSGISDKPTQEFITEHYCNGYYRSYENPLVREQVLKVLGAEPGNATFDAFLEAEEVFNKEPTLAFDLTYKAPRKVKTEVPSAEEVAEES